MRFPPGNCGVPVTAIANSDEIRVSARRGSIKASKAVFTWVAHGSYQTEA